MRWGKLMNCPDGDQPDHFPSSNIAPESLVLTRSNDDGAFGWFMCDKHNYTFAFGQIIPSFTRMLPTTRWICGSNKHFVGSKGVRLAGCAPEYAVDGACWTLQRAVMSKTWDVWCVLECVVGLIGAFNFALWGTVFFSCWNLWLTIKQYLHYKCERMQIQTY